MGFISVYFLLREIRKDRSLFNECFSKAWSLVVAIYVFSVFPSSILNIIYRDRCVCSDGFSLNAWRDEARDLFKSFTGASVIFLQILLHFAEIYYRFRRLWRFIGTYVFCMKVIPDKDETGRNPLICFVISVFLAVGYTALFMTEIMFIFCVQFK